MRDLDDVIRYERENTALDFKAKQYAKNEDLLKDLIAMANSDVSGDRHIIVGVKMFPDSSREFWSIEKKDFVDSGNYHQLVRGNIEPEIHFDYDPYEFEGHLLGVLRVYDCNDQPYTMRKDYGPLKAGDAWIRKGTHQPRLMRPDLDRIWQRRTTEFTAKIKIGFHAPSMPKEIALPAIGKLALPSERAAEKIRSILKEREQPPPQGELSLSRHLIESGVFPGSLLNPPPYEHRSTKNLRENLEKVKDSYRKDDLYELYEVHGEKINFVVLNEGESYVEDASIDVKIPRLDGLRVAQQIHQMPDRGPFGIERYVPGILGMQYPNVRYQKSHIRVRQDIGSLRHGIPVFAFQEPIRVVFEDALVGQKVELECLLYGKQLRTPRSETLTIQVTEPNEEVKK